MAMGLSFLCCLLLMLLPTLSSACEGFSPHMTVGCSFNTVATATISAKDILKCTPVLPERVLALTLNHSSTDDTSRSLSIAPDAVANFTALRCLRMRKLGVSSLPANLFSGLLHLEVLDLSSNQLSSLPADLLSGLVQLERLDLSANHLIALPKNFLSGLVKLAQLDLSANQLGSLPDGLFDGLVQLRRLDLSSNQLHSLPVPGPPRWPIDFDLRVSANPRLKSCWYLNASRLVVPKSDAWWCYNYASILSGVYLSSLTFPKDDLSVNRSRRGSDDVLVWNSPTNFLYTFANATVWQHVFGLVVTKVDVSSRAGQVHIENFRPYFAGVWTCLRVRLGGRTTSSPRVQVVRQLLVRCQSPLRSIYIWSLFVSAACTVAMILAGLLTSFIRLLVVTRCFTRKIHVISTMSLEDLQYSPRTQRKRLAILRNYEANRAALLASETAGGDASLLASTAASIDESEEVPSSPSATPHWLPPHRLAYTDPFAHGGGVSGGEEEMDEEEEGEGDEGEEGEEGWRWRQRLRLGMVRHVAEVRERMREQRQNMEESTGRIMRHLKSGGHVAALKVRTGLATSVDAMKWKVKDLTELCGTSGGAALGQTVSVSTLVTDLDTQTTTERRVMDITDV